MTAAAALTNRKRKVAKRKAPKASRRPKVAGLTVTSSDVVARAAEVPGDRDGLLWLIGKGRLTPVQRVTAEAYRRDYQEAAITGAMLKSCLDVRPRGSGTPAGPGALIEGSVDAQARLYRKRFDVLHGQVHAIELLDGVCGRRLTLMALAGGSGRLAFAYELLFKAVLDQLAAAGEG